VFFLFLFEWKERETDAVEGFLSYFGFRPGYIAGVTNPIFELHTEAWDVFCNIETGKIAVSKDIAMPLSSARPFSPAPLERSITELTTASGGGGGGGGLPLLPAPSPLANKDDSLLKSSNTLASLKVDTAKDSLDNLMMEDVSRVLPSLFLVTFVPGVAPPDE
jgi:hypothetical protein